MESHYKLRVSGSELPTNIAIIKRLMALNIPPKNKTKHDHFHLELSSGPAPSSTCVCVCFRGTYHAGAQFINVI